MLDFPAIDTNVVHVIVLDDFPALFTRLSVCPMKQTITRIAQGVRSAAVYDAFA